MCREYDGCWRGFLLLAIAQGCPALAVPWGWALVLLPALHTCIGLCCYEFARTDSEIGAAERLPAFAPSVTALYYVAYRL